MELDHVKDMRVKGIGKFFHGLVMFITYPIRHVFKFFAFLFVTCVLLAAVPMSQGVSYRHVLDWYLMRYTDAKEKVESGVKVFEIPAPEKETTARFQEVSAPKVIRKNPRKSPEDVRQRVFKRPPVKLPEQVIRKQSASEPIVKIAASQETPVNRVPSVKEQPAAEKQKAYYRIDSSLNLDYEAEPKEIRGKTIVFNANEMAVGDTYIILYGIYTEPNTQNAAKAFRYLQELVEGKELKCKVVAYTKEYIATGVCFADGHSINQNLVDAGFAENIAL